VLDERGRRELEAGYRELGADLWRAVYAYSGGLKEIADDAVAEAFAQAGHRLGQIRSLRPWVYTAAFRIARGELQRRGRSIRMAGHSPGRVAEDGLSDVIELARRLSPRQRGAFVLRDVFGYSSREAADLLGVSEVAVRVHLHGARRRLRAHLTEEPP
jgi:RNA polymerase sigma-70 factor, ECF subfamily